MSNENFSHKEQPPLRKEAVICFVCHQDGANLEAEVWDTCQACRGNGVIQFGQRCNGCGGSGERWELVAVHKHCI
jgi:DnaJ-class molecular chaperone